MCVNVNLVERPLLFAWQGADTGIDLTMLFMQKNEAWREK
jgi:hypothetical protein